MTSSTTTNDSRSTSARTTSTDAASSAKQQFLDAYAREHATTLKVLAAFPADQQDFKPHPTSNTALDLAWTFVVEQKLCSEALQGPLNFGAGFGKPPATLAECVAAFQAEHDKVVHQVERASDEDLAQPVTFPSGPGTMADQPRLGLLWFMLLDQIHHRGQLSVYLRMTGGKVPSIYGPSKDEPWF
jgi:uncharacterized damage-inducible protein DinB